MCCGLVCGPRELSRLDEKKNSSRDKKSAKSTTNQTTHSTHPFVMYNSAGQPAAVAVASQPVATTTTTTRTLIAVGGGNGVPGEYTFIQPQRCCELQRVSMTVNVQEGHVVHDTRRACCCLVCDERYFRESDVASVVTVNTYIASEACRIFRIVTSLLLFIFFFTSGVTLLCLMNSRANDAVSSVADAMNDLLVRTVANATPAYGSAYSNYQYDPSSYDYYGGVSVVFGASYGVIGLCLASLFLVVGVGAWIACCLRLHHVSVILRSAGFRRSTMDIWLTPPDTARLGEVRNSDTRD